MTGHQKYFLKLILALLICLVGLIFIVQKNNNDVFFDLPGLSAENILYRIDDIRPAKENILTDTETLEMRRVSFLFFGDLMLDRNVKTKIGESNNIDFLFKGLAREENRFFMSPDIISANLEGAVTSSGVHYPPISENDFAFNTSTVNGLKKYNFNFFNIANNHITDQGPRGLTETTTNLTTLGFDFSGCADTQIGDCSYKIVNKNGIKVAMVGLSQVYHLLDINQASELIKKIRAQADIIVVNAHWGNEYEHNFNSKQSAPAHTMIDAGADIIIGHHPHVVQGLEIYKNKPIFYSLGNFIFDQYFSTDTQEELGVGMNYHQADKKMILYLFPMRSVSSVPQLMVDREKNEFLNKFVTWSKLEESKKSEILSGILNL
ncbi:MAG: hypothetical protein C3F02_04605 [Parcubacteria group bacterium]|nr:MAG: hypothetical protein C3F02_04605 [Parcubacteria group bacterium]